MNTYSLKARIYPVILSLLPILIIGILFSIEFQNYYQSIGSLGLSTVLFFLFSQLGRDRGKKKEKQLWKEWQGSPTTQLFRFSNDTIDPTTKKAYHDKMNSFVLSSIIPSIKEEEKSPETCDQIYKSWTKFLISKTRDTSKFNLLFSENINYGFRRNAYGLKPFAIIVILLLYFAIWASNYLTNDGFNFTDKSTLVSQFILIIPLIFWVFVVNKEWIKIPAFAYAERLLETINEIKNV